jgi:hypothetical protein
MEAVLIFETSVHFKVTTLRYIPEDSELSMVSRPCDDPLNCQLGLCVQGPLVYTVWRLFYTFNNCSQYVMVSVISVQSCSIIYGPVLGFTG